MTDEFDGKIGIKWGGVERWNVYSGFNFNQTIDAFCAVSNRRDRNVIGVDYWGFWSKLITIMLVKNI